MKDDEQDPGWGHEDGGRMLSALRARLEVLYIMVVLAGIFVWWILFGRDD